MKAKKTIRKLPKISRKLYNMQKRLTTMISEVTEAEKKLAVYELLDAEAENDCRAESDATAGALSTRIENEHEPAPPGGPEGRQNGPPDCRLVVERDRWLP